MQLVRWKFHNINIPMVDIEGTLYCTSRVLATALGVKEQTLRTIYSNRSDEFDGCSVNNIDANEFLHEHKELLGIKRLRKDAHLWSEDDMLTFGMLARSTHGREFRKGLKQFIKDHALKEYVSKADYERLMDKFDEISYQNSLLNERNAIMEKRLSALEKVIDLAAPHLEESASAAGKALNAQKGTKALRTIN